MLFLIADPMNISIGPFLYGGDALGVAKGLEIPVLLVQGVAFIVFLINRELVSIRVLPAYDIKTKHPFFVPWFARAH